MKGNKQISEEDAGNVQHRIIGQVSNIQRQSILGYLGKYPIILFLPIQIRGERMPAQTNNKQPAIIG